MTARSQIAARFGLSLGFSWLSALAPEAALAASGPVAEISLEACEDQANESNETIRSCLNRFAKGVLAGQVRIAGVATLPELFEHELREKLDGYKYQISEGADLSTALRKPVVPLSEQFKIEIPRVQDPSDRHLRPCFDFEQSERTVALPAFGRALIRQVKNQIIEAALFLKYYHVRSMGRTGSFLFQINTVRVCGAKPGTKTDSLLARFDEHVLAVSPKPLSPAKLYFGEFGKDEETVTTAHAIEDGWNDGTVPFGLEMSFIKELYLKVRHNKIARLRDGLRLLWQGLNPVGELRTPLRYELEKLLSEKFDDPTSDKRQILLRIISRVGAKASDLKDATSLRPDGTLTEDLAERILAEWKAALNEPGLKEKIFEQAVLYSSLGGANVEMIDRRQVSADIVVKNQKQIVVDASFLFGGDELGVEKLIDEEPRGQGLSVRQVLESTVTAKLVAVDLTDQVAVAVKLRAPISKLIARVTLNQAVTRALAK
jgi:hypothetical protein